MLEEEKDIEGGPAVGWLVVVWEAWFEVAAAKAEEKGLLEAVWAVDGEGMMNVGCANLDKVLITRLGGAEIKDWTTVVVKKAEEVMAADFHSTEQNHHGYNLDGQMGAQ